MLPLVESFFLQCIHFHDLYEKNSRKQTSATYRFHPDIRNAMVVDFDDSSLKIEKNKQFSQFGKISTKLMLLLVSFFSPHKSLASIHKVKSKIKSHLYRVLFLLYLRNVLKTKNFSTLKTLPHCTLMPPKCYITQFHQW